MYAHYTLHDDPNRSMFAPSFSTPRIREPTGYGKFGDKSLKCIFKSAAANATSQKKEFLLVKSYF